MQFLVATDGSDVSQNALTTAFDVAEAMGAEVTVVHAVDPSVHDEGGADPITTLGDADDRLVVESVDDAEARGFDLLEEAAELAAERGHQVETELLYGDPAREIVEFAADGGFDAVFVGHRGLSERTERMLGSVAKTVVERSDVPVTVVR